MTPSKGVPYFKKILGVGVGLVRVTLISRGFDEMRERLMSQEETRVIKRAMAKRVFHILRRF